MIKDGLDRDADSRQVAPEFGNVLEAIVRNWAAIIERIPTRYLEESITTALQLKTDAWPFSAYAINKAYEEMKPELERRARLEVTQRGYLSLPEGSKPKPFSPSEFRRKHNLPDDWRPGQPYPPCSDLYKGPIDLE